jgi:hypothetical protein
MQKLKYMLFNSFGKVHFFYELKYKRLQPKGDKPCIPENNDHKLVL